MPSDFFSGSLGQNILLALKYIYIVAPIILPIIFVGALFNAWVSYKRTLFLSKQGSLLLEVKLPKEISRSPAAMEVIIGAFFQVGGEQTWVDRIWYGKTRVWSSLEIVSEGGQVHFYIWIRPNLKNAIEAQIYSQFPGIEVHEVADYILPYSYDPEKNTLWGCEWKLSQKPDALPIKTYVDYGLDDTLTKDEQKIDPIAPMVEFLGSLKEGQNIFIQIIIRAHRKRRLADVFGEKEDSWKDDAKKEVADLITKMKGGDKPGTPLTGAEKRKMESIERSVGKMPFDVGIRSIYFADKDKFDGSNIGGMLGSFRQFGSPELNGFSPTAWFVSLSPYPWGEFNRKHKEEMYRRLILEQYKMRQFFFSPYMGKKYYSRPFVLNSEELATIYHFPSQLVVSTPTFERIPSKKSEAPANLPV